MLNPAAGPAAGEYVEDTEEYINIELDSSRNRLIRLEVVLTAGTFALAIFTLVGGGWLGQRPSATQAPSACHWMGIAPIYARQLLPHSRLCIGLLLLQTPGARQTGCRTRRMWMSFNIAVTQRQLVAAGILGENVIIPEGITKSVRGFWAVNGITALVCILVFYGVHDLSSTRCH